MDIRDQDLIEIAKAIRYMAESGRGTDLCLEEECLPLPVHFYSPVPDLKDLARRKIWDRISPLRGLDMRPREQIELLTQMASLFGNECVWPADETSDPHQFHYKNNSFSFQCASLLHYMIRFYQPKRIIEIGSGQSSRVINAAIKLNKDESKDCNYQIVDPFPSEQTKVLSNLSSINITKVEELDDKFFSPLEHGDILFIDSSHVVKVGGDVNFLILDVLPMLKPGVVIHFHDISLPAEYPEVYYTNPAFRMLWTEAYLLQAFLSCNKDFEILVAAAYLRIHYPDSLSKFYPLDPRAGSSGSFWLRRHSA